MMSKNAIFFQTNFLGLAVDLNMPHICANILCQSFIYSIPLNMFCSGCSSGFKNLLWVHEQLLGKLFVHINCELRGANSLGIHTIE